MKQLLLTAVLLLPGFFCTSCLKDPMRDIIQAPVAPVAQAIVKNKTVSLDVNYCTLPSQKRSFRTKFVVVFDRSGSNQPRTEVNGAPPKPGTDPDESRRFDGMQKFVDSLTTEQKNLYSFALVYFSAVPMSYLTTSYPGLGVSDMDRGFSDYHHSFMSSNEFSSLLACPPGSACAKTDPKGEKNPNNSSALVPRDAGWTDYLLGLQMAAKIIDTDVAANAPASGATGTDETQSAYVVIFVSDGAPIVFATNDPHYTSGPPKVWTYRQPWSDPTLQSDIQRSIEKLTNYSQYPGVLGVSVNTIYYSAPNVAQDVGTGCVGSLSSSCTPCIANDPSCTPTGLLQKMASSGNGQFLDYSSGNPIDFTKISLPSMFMSYGLVDSFANNRNVVWENGVLVKDSDGDGLSDDFELQHGLDPNSRSTLANGISDGVYYKVCGDDPGCDITGMIQQKCNSPLVKKTADGNWADSDSDGLNDCEEALLGSDPQRFDSNNDILPDGLEFSKGIPFKTGAPPCWSEDEDFDEINDCLEAKQNTPTTRSNADIPELKPYKYTVTSTTTTATNQCYNIHVDNVTVLSDHDQIEFLVVEQPNLLRSEFVLRKATKTVSGETATFSPEDFN